MNYSKDIFDYTKLSEDVRMKLQIGDLFRDKLYNLFKIAKSQNIDTLSDDQITVAYYRTYTSKDPKDLKTLQQIQGKLLTITRNEYEQESNGLKIEKVKNEKKWYTIK